MKKILLSIMCVALLAGCAAQNNNTAQSTSESSTGNTNVAETTVEITGVNTKNYSNDKVVWGPGRAENHQRPTDPVQLQEK